MNEEIVNDAPDLNATSDKRLASRKPRKRSVSKTANKAEDLKGRHGLQDEILMLRAMMRRIKALADEGRSLPELLSVLKVLGLASTRLVTLLKAERALAEDQDLAAALSQALSQVTKELGIVK